MPQLLLAENGDLLRHICGNLVRVPFIQPAEFHERGSTLKSG